MTEYELRTSYTPEIHALTPEAAWAAWEAGELTVYQVWKYQEHHKIIFNSTGGIENVQ